MIEITNLKDEYNKSARIKEAKFCKSIIPPQ